MRETLLIKIITASFLLAFMPSAHALNKCKIIKRLKSELELKKSDLQKIEAIHRQQVKAKEISSELINSDEIAEIRLLAEALDEEVLSIEEGQVYEAKGVAASIGAVILSSYIIKKLNRKSVGLKRKILAQAMPKENNRRFTRHSLNAALIFSVASTYVLSKSIKENQDKKQMLTSLIIKLNSIKDLTEDLIDLREEVDEREVTFNIRLEELVFNNIVEVEVDSDSKEVIYCLTQ